jgi:hypothetical protein
MISAEAVVEGEEVSAHTRVLFLPEVVPVVTIPGGLVKVTLPADKVQYSANQMREAIVIGVEIMIKPEGETEFRPADFAIAKGLRPQIRFEFYPSIKLFDVAWVQEFPLPWPYPLPLGIAIHVDDGSDETSLDRKTFDAIKDDPAFRVDVENNSVTWDLTKLETTPLSQGWNRIRVLAEIADPLSANQWTEGLAIASTTFLIPPFALEFAEYDVVRIEFPGYPSQTLTFTGMFRFIFWKKYEYLSTPQETDILHALLTELKIRSTTPLYIPGVGSTFLEIVRDPAELTFGELDLKQNKLFWELNALVRLVDTDVEPIPIKLVIEDRWSANRHGVSLKATGEGRIDPDTRIFGGTTFYLNPGSGCSKPKEEEEVKLGTSQESLQKLFNKYMYTLIKNTIVALEKEKKGPSIALSEAFEIFEAASRIKQLQKFSEKQARAMISIVGHIFQNVSEGDIDGTRTQIGILFEKFDEAGIPIPAHPFRKQIIDEIEKILSEKYKGIAGRDHAEKVYFHISDLLANLREKK